MKSMIRSAHYYKGISHKHSHFHDCHQLLFITRGMATVQVAGQVYHACPGTLVLISRFEEHSVHAESPDYCRYALEIAPDAHNSTPDAGQLLGVLVDRPAGFCHTVQFADVAAVEGLFAATVRELQTDAMLRVAMLDMLLLQILVYACRENPALLPSNDADLVRQVQHLFESQYATAFTLQELARQYHVSQSHLCHLFKRTTGQSVMGYLQSCRVAAAKRCLAHTNWEIGTIVAHCGFSDNSNFSRTFKAITGMTPTQFRARNQ